MTARLLNIAVIGAGRIGKLHAENLATRINSSQLAAVADIKLPAAQEIARRFNVPLATDDYRSLLGHSAIDAVAICSASNTHAEIILEAAAAGKHIFCEKPIDYDLRRIHRCLEAVAKAGVKLQVGFNRRFDPNFAKVRELVATGKIGQPHIVRITSRDPAPPPLEYVKVSGGLFFDMTIHDFDMVRFLSGSEAEEILALGDALVDPQVAGAGDVDTAIITMRLKSGALATIDNSRKAVYGYDQRVEVFGSNGMATVSNRTPDTHILANSDGVHTARPQQFFFDRYHESYIAELQAFVDCVLRDLPPPVSGQDGLAPVLMGLAAAKSLKERRLVTLREIISE
ncbi:MAG: inositol 2-dehydrogenase [Verrucomicrobia bacterium]|nr:inositol 2-dehydrogenase [Verrucomicrobiota bacterium]